MKKMLISCTFLALSAAQSWADTQTLGAYYVPIGQNYVSWAYPFINLQTAIGRGLTGRGVTVAVFDTGINASSYKFSGNIAGPGYNIYTGGSVTTDGNGHGTFVSSLIAANTQTQGTAMTMYGVASSAKILPIQVMNSSGQGSWTDGQLAAGINYAANNGARVFNNSWGTNLMLSQVSTAAVLKENAATISAYEKASARGVVNVFAAGNYGTSSPDYYATLPSINSKLLGSWIVVAAADTNGAIASWSNRCGIAASYCLTAPGSNIVGLYGNQLALGSGTSFAAPIVSGGIALLIQQWPYLTGQQITSLLLRTANKTGIYANSAIYGQGMINLAAATAPQGAVVIPTGADVNSSSLPLALGGLSLPSTFGHIDTLGNGMMVLDDYGRAYSLGLNSVMTSSRSTVDLTAQLARFGQESLVQEAAGFKVGLVDDANAAQGLAPVTPLPGLGNPYLSMGQDQKLLISSQGVTVWYSQHQTPDSTDPLLTLQQLSQPRIMGAFYQWRDLQLGMVHEENSLYGQQAAVGSSLATGADTAFASLGHAWQLGSGYQLDASGSLGISKLAGVNQLVSGTEPVVLASAALGISKVGVFAESDRLGLVASLPNHSISGSANLSLPVSRDFDGNISYQPQRISLVGTGTETDLQAYWTNSFSERSKLTVAAGLRLQPDGDAKAGTQGVAMLRYNLRF
jgi:subtilisin family serine protease